MAKGSQLVQLKSALHQAGVTGQQNGKKRKRSVSQEKDKAQKTAKLNEIYERLNPFDVKVTKTKHDLNGRKVKGIIGKPAKSKQAGIEQRRKTLLKEFEEKNRTGGIVDRRFGENDPQMSIEERMLERFTRERQRGSRNAAFNLGDDDELTHYGKSLSKLDDFDDIRLPTDEEEEEEDGQISRDIVGITHFSGFDEEGEDSDKDTPGRRKSKAEVMAEVIAKSKEHKMLRQIEREQQDNVRHELDEAFDSMRDLLFASAPQPVSMSDNSAVTLGSNLRQPLFTDDMLLGAGSGKEGIDVYDQHVRELAFDKRAKAKDRLKTEEEIALEQKEALENAERKRRRRMLGEGDADEDTPRKKRYRGGDDLEDDFAENDWQSLGVGLGDVGTGDEGETASEGEDETVFHQDEDQEDEDEDTSGSDNEKGSVSDTSDHDRLHIAKQRASKELKVSGELPFTFPCPTSLEEFIDIVGTVSDSDVPTIIHRIRTLHHPSFAPANTARLQGFTGVLIDYYFYAASQRNEPRFPLLNSIVPHIRALTRTYPTPAAVRFNANLSLMHHNLKRGLNLSTGSKDAKTWPGLAELCFLRLISELWPTSDLNHAVVSPTRSLMGAYLGLSRVRSLSDIASGAFLATLFLEFESLSRRYVPEVVNFLINAVLHLAPHEFTSSNLPGSFPSPDLDSHLELKLSRKGPVNLSPQKAVLVTLLASQEPSEQTKVDLLSQVLRLLGRFADLYKGLPAFIEGWDPVKSILEGVKAKYLCEELKSQLHSLKDVLHRLLKFSRQARKPLLLQAHKPIPIPSYVPKFDVSSSSYLRYQDPDHERNQVTKLRKQYKQERRGAIRELRKDARFLAGMEREKQNEKDQAYHDRMKKVFGSIEGERAEQKAMERENAREKRKTGRK